MDQGIKKRTIVLDGRKTSVSLEDAFYLQLKELARRRDVSVGDLVKLAAMCNPASSLSSSVRLFLLDEIRGMSVERDTLDHSEAR